MSSQYSIYPKFWRSYEYDDFLFPSERKIPSDRRHNVSCQWWLQKERLGSSKVPGSNGKTSTGDIWLDSSWSVGERAGDVDRDSKSVKVITLPFLSLWSYWLPEICQADGSVHRTHPSKACLFMASSPTRYSIISVTIEIRVAVLWEMLCNQHFHIWSL